MTLAPIALFVYNRPWHTQQTVEALAKNTLAPNSDLIIFADGPKKKESEKAVQEVRNYLRSIQGFKSITIHESAPNKGLANSIIEGVTKILSQAGTIVVMEDDMITSPFFLQYMNDALKLYEEYEEVVSIHGYIYPVKEKLPETFFLKGADCWGWATWKDRWKIFEADGKKLLDQIKEKKLTREFDFNGNYGYTSMLKKQIQGKNDSWAIRWYASAFLKNKLTLYPGQSLVKNIGNDNSGTHSKTTNVYQTEISIDPIKLERIDIEENKIAKAIISNYFNTDQSILRRWLKKIL